MRNQERRGPRVVIAGALAATILAGSIVPAAAAFPNLVTGAGAAQDGGVATFSAFRRHFYRGQPGLHAELDAERRSSGGTMATVDEAAWHDYCSSRFRSYDPSTGAYLGYDGIYRPCT